MRKILVVLLIILSIGVTAQITFQKTFGGISYGNDRSYCVQQTSDGGYIIAATIDSFGAGASDVYLIKTNNIGDTLWTKTFGGINDDVGYSVQQTTDGGYIVVGYTTSFGAGNADVYLIRTDSIGDTVWTKTFGGINSEQGYSVQKTADGGYIIAGGTSSFGAGSVDVYLIKTDNNGDTLWTKTIGGTDYDYAYSIKQTTDSGYIIVGTNGNVLLIKTNSIGDTLWTKYFLNGNAGEGIAVQQTYDSGYIIAGTYHNSAMKSSNGFLIKTDNIGDTLWTKFFGGGGSHDNFNSVQQTTDGGYIIGGGGEMDSHLIKTDSSGNVLWSNAFGQASPALACYSVEQTTDGGFIIITGPTYGAVIYLIKTDSNGRSGCNELTPDIWTTPPSTLVGIPAMSVSSSPTIVTTPATITGSGGIVNTLCFSSGTGEIADNKYSVLLFPNPTTNTFTIKNTSSKEKTLLEITNVFGEIVYTEKLFGKNEYIVNLNLSEGIYFVRVSDAESNIVRKLIVE